MYQNQKGTPSNDENVCFMSYLPVASEIEWNFKNAQA